MKTDTLPIPAIQQLYNMAVAAKQKKYPNIPFEFLVKPKFSERNEKGVTACIIAWLILNHCQVQQIKVTDRAVFGTVLAGSVNGKHIVIQISKTRDTVGERKTPYQIEVERSGTLYITTSSFTDFYQQYQTLIK